MPFWQILAGADMPIALCLRVRPSCGLKKRAAGQARPSFSRYCTAGTGSRPVTGAGRKGGSPLLWPSPSFSWPDQTFKKAGGPALLGCDLYTVLNRKSDSSSRLSNSFFNPVLSDTRCSMRTALPSILAMTSSGPG